MSVIIKGMDIPKSCCECAICEINTGYHFCPLVCTGVGTLLTVRHPDCPLVEIPKNHGDIVDLEAFAKFGTTVLLGAEKEDKE